jgi:hypothetical protein
VICAFYCVLVLVYVLVRLAIDLQKVFHSNARNHKTVHRWQGEYHRNRSLLLFDKNPRHLVEFAGNSIHTIFQEKFVNWLMARIVRVV